MHPREGIYLTVLYLIRMVPTERAVQCFGSCVFLLSGTPDTR